MNTFSLFIDMEQIRLKSPLTFTLHLSPYLRGYTCPFSVFTCIQVCLNPQKRSIDGGPVSWHLLSIIKT